MSEPIEELKFDISVNHFRGEREPTYSYNCPTFVEMGQKINEIISAINNIHVAIAARQIQKEKEEKLI